MSRLFIFAIGGTGARVLRSFTMLLASGQQLLKDVDVYPIILDYDEKNGDTTIATGCIDTYNKIHNTVWKDPNFAHEEGYFKSNLLQLAPDNPGGGSAFRMVYAPDENKEQYKNYIGFDTLGIDEPNTERSRELHGDKAPEINTSNTRLLLESLYNTDPLSDDSEMFLKMDVGFKGNPNIGSVVFHDIDKECDEFRKFLTLLNNNDKVIVVGSLFGGTGSSGVPEIIKKIHVSKPDVPIGAVLVMPYFAPKPKDGGTIRHEVFNSKTKAAINYYEANGLIESPKNDSNKGKDGGIIRSAYFIGDPKPTVLEYCDGGEDQRNPANVVEFVGALSIMHFLSLSFAGGNNVGGCFKYGVGSHLIGENVAVKQLFHDDLRDAFTASVIKRLTSFTIAMKYFMFRTMNPPTGFVDKLTDNLTKTTYYKTFSLDDPEPDMKKLMNELNEFWNEYKDWLDELSNKGRIDDQGNSHGLTLFSTEEDLEILIMKSTNSTKKPKNKSVEGKTIDGLINEAIKKFRPNGFEGKYTCKDPEFLFMHGLYKASTDEEEIINKVYDLTIK